MPTKRLSMRRIHRLMTLHFGAGAATRAISRELGISHSTVREYLARIAAAGITLAAAGGTHRPGAGTAVVRQRRCAGRSTPLRRAGLGGGRAGAEAPGRQPDDPMGGISGRSSLMATPTAVMLRPYLCCAPRSDFRTYRSAAFS